jgi:hypothetical protein
VTRILLALVLAALLSGCRKPRCEDLETAEVGGLYKGGGTLGDERLLRVSVNAAPKQVVLTYTAMDGSRIRAQYQVTKKKKLP